MKTALAALTAILKYTALALMAVKEVETQIGPGNGATKKQIALASILAAAHAGEQTDDLGGKIATISTVIDATVGMLNATGVFGKSTPAQ